MVHLSESDRELFVRGGSGCFSEQKQIDSRTHYRRAGENLLMLMEKYASRFIL